jgi:DNA helicase II / ATP-dependent DNA helicase PcrA
MDKTVMLAVAGSGKTSKIVKELNNEKRSLLITYTENNLKNLRRKIIEKFGHFPDNIFLFSYFTFLYSFCLKPFLWRDARPNGINWKNPPAWTMHISRDKEQFYFDMNRRLYHNRIAKLLEVRGIVKMVNSRIEKYFDILFIDEVQDFGGHDFNFLSSIASANLDMLFVGDFFQHTFDTSRDGVVNKSLHDDFDNYVKRLQKMGLNVDYQTLNKSHRCSPTVCAFLTEKLGIKIESHRPDETLIQLVETANDIQRLHNCMKTVKLFYKEHYTYGCYSRNWGDSKGEDHYSDVCIILNKTSYDSFKKGSLNDLNPQTRNKFYVACSRTRNDLYFVPEFLYKKL